VLTDYHYSVQLVRDKRKFLLIEIRALLVNNKDSESIVVTVHQDGLRDFDANELRYLSHFLSFKSDLFNDLVIVFGVEVSDVEGLLSENMIAELGKVLNQLKRLDFSIFFLNFIRNLVRSLSSQPLIGPLLKIEISMGM